MIGTNETPKQIHQGVPIWYKVMRRVRQTALDVLRRLDNSRYLPGHIDLPPCVVVRVGDIIVVEPAKDEGAADDLIRHLLHEVTPAEFRPSPRF